MEVLLFVLVAEAMELAARRPELPQRLLLNVILPNLDSLLPLCGWQLELEDAQQVFWLREYECNSLACVPSVCSLDVSGLN